ncbi:hypothetical protein PFISCL1PPCAC_2706, partial [Pristionchus fissidentatus]
GAGCRMRGPIWGGSWGSTVGITLTGCSCCRAAPTGGDCCISNCCCCLAMFLIGGAGGARLEEGEEANRSTAVTG